MRAMRTPSRFVTRFLFVVVCGVLATTQAQTPPTGESIYEQPLVTVGGVYSNEGGLVAADQFTIEEPATITGVIWYGFFSDNTIDPAKTRQDFRISFFSDRSGLPTPRRSYERTVRVRVRDSGRRTTGFTGGQRVVYEFAAESIPPFKVNARTINWISIATPGPPTINWLWSTGSGGQKGTAGRNTNPARSTDWRQNQQTADLAFSLTGSRTTP